MRVEKKDLLLCAIPDRKWLQGETLANQVELALCGGATMIQMRNQMDSDAEFIQDALELQQLCKVYQVPFIINDDIRLAKELNADGVHLGQKLGDLMEARRILGDAKLIGVSVQNEEEADYGEKYGADYLRYRVVYLSDTRPEIEPVGLKYLRKICDRVSCPIVAAGGITEQKLLELSGSGISGIAVTGAVFGQEDIKNAARRLKRRLQNIAFIQQMKV